MANVKQEISRKFQVKDMGVLHHFLGVKVIQDDDTGSNWIGQQQYTENILRKFGINDCKATRILVDVSTKSVDSSDGVDQKSYQSAVGSLLYLSLSTIAFAVNNVAKFCAKPNKQHWTAVNFSLFKKELSIIDYFTRQLYLKVVQGIRMLIGVEI